MAVNASVTKTVTAMISAGKVHLAALLLNISLIHSKIGDKAFWSCTNYARVMPECHNVLHPNTRRRIPIDLLLYPHMVLIGYRMAPELKTKWQCGGTLVSDLWVLTAAHCMEDPHNGPATYLKIGIATFEFDEVEGLDQDRTVAERLPHPDYKPPSKYHDIALLRADRPFVLSRDIRTACLQLTSEVDASSATVIGFGTTSSGASVGSLTLRAVDVDIVDSKTCNESVRGLIRRGKLKHGITEDLICAGDYENGGRDACQGDSGGPLQYMPERVDCVRRFPLHAVIGVASFGSHCGYKRSPGVYTRVSRYIEWIEGHVWPSMDQLIFI